MTHAISKADMVIAEDTLIADVQFAIHNLLATKRISRAELARRIDVSKARISQIFKDNTRNLTLRTIAQIFHAVGEEARVTSPALDRIIPAEATTSKQGARPSHVVTKIEVTSIRLREEERSRLTFQRECNDNFDTNEFDLVA